MEKIGPRTKDETKKIKKITTTFATFLGLGSTFLMEIKKKIDIKMEKTKPDKKPEKNIT